MAAELTPVKTDTGVKSAHPVYFDMTAALALGKRQTNQIIATRVGFSLGRMLAEVLGSP
jgi:hypothetical protein